MSDEPGPDRDTGDRDIEREAEQDAAQERVRRLLAAARHDEPAPPDVVARLDAALAAEAARRPTASTPASSPASTPAPAPVVDLAARRRQRRRTGLLAAAVVVVAGVGVGSVVLDGGSLVGGAGGGAGDSSAGGSESSAESDAGSDTGAPEALEAPRQDGQERTGPGPLSARAPLPRVRTGATLSADVARALRTGEALAGDRARCAPASAADEVVAVRVDGERAELLVTPPAGGSREVSLHPCATADDTTSSPLATLVVPAG